MISSLMAACILYTTKLVWQRDSLSISFAMAAVINLLQLGLLLRFGKTPFELYLDEDKEGVWTLSKHE
jgi:hypothetical protein